MIPDAALVEQARALVSTWLTARGTFGDWLAVGATPGAQESLAVTIAAFAAEVAEEADREARPR